MYFVVQPLASNPLQADIENLTFRQKFDPFDQRGRGEWGRWGDGEMGRVGEITTNHQPPTTNH
ncbi:MAG: hypothetical protein HXY43_25165 [Fischerella sp.]|uniref:hypothetical protein n=1 Tax=Fischerella sp. TaxID=1191 RepID=UPI0018552772|nr:hypothetical protein [Fischerella sp.]NWF62439.1 hypothetical protein [Fischerella sp.]